MSDRLLRAALLGNAAFSTLSGSLMLLGPDRVVTWLGVDPMGLVPLVGGGLLVFAADLVHQATRPVMSPPRALVSVLGDASWVLGTAVLVPLLGHTLSTTGLALVLGVALVVATFGTLQAVGLQRLFANPTPHAGRHRVCLAFDTDAPIDRLWPIVRDLGGIARHSEALTTTFLRDDEQPGSGAVRECTDTSGHTWAEACTALDDTHHTATLRFLADEPGFPFPMTEMIGGWQLTASPTGTRVEVWWTFTLAVEPLAWLMMPVLEHQQRRGMGAVIASMTAEATGRPAPAAPLVATAC